MRKILYCITKGNFGGAQRYVYDLATHIDKNKYEVKVLCGEGESLPKRLEEKGIEVIRLKSLKRDIGIMNEIRSFIEIYKVFKKEKPDVVHLNSSKMGGIGSFIGRLSGVKNIIFTAHGFAFNEDRSFISRKILLAFHYLTILLCHKVIMVSEKTMKDINYLPFIKDKLVKIYNGIDVNLEFYPRDKVKKILLKNVNVRTKNKTILLSIGELHKNKGYDLFIKNLKTLDKDFAYLIIGEGEERNELARILKANDLREKVFLLGRVEDAYKYLKIADIFVLPSRTEAFPYALLEAGLAQSTVLASNVGGISEAIIENETGLLFDIHNNKECLDKLTVLIDNTELREKLALNIHNKVVNDFSLTKMITKTVDVYRI